MCVFCIFFLYKLTYIDLFCEWNARRVLLRAFQHQRRRRPRRWILLFATACMRVRGRHATSCCPRCHRCWFMNTRGIVCTCIFTVVYGHAACLSYSYWGGDVWTEGKCGGGEYFNTILHLFRVHSLLFALGRKSVNGNSVPLEHLDVLENRNSGPRVWLILNKIVSGLDNPYVCTPDVFA